MVERYSDVLDMNHPWVTEYRIPVVNGIGSSGDYKYFVSLGLPCRFDEEINPATNIYNLEFPTEAEVALIASYIQFRIQTLGYTDWYREKFQAEPLDTDNGINTINLGKNRRFGWVYKKATWMNQGFWPHADTELRYPELIDLLDKIESYGDNNLNPKWENWKLEHNLVPVTV